MPTRAAAFCFCGPFSDSCCFRLPPINCPVMFCRSSPQWRRSRRWGSTNWRTLELGWRLARGCSSPSRSPRPCFPPQSRTSGRPPRSPAFDWTWMMPLVPLAAVWILEARGQRLAAVLVVTAATAIGVTYLKIRCEPEMERIATARALARKAAAHRGSRVPRRDQARSGVRARVLPWYSLAVLRS